MSYDATRYEEARHAILSFLAVRPSISHSTSAIRRGVNREGGDYSDKEIREETEYLVGGGLVSVVDDPLGSTRYYQVTTQGRTAFERGRA